MSAVIEARGVKKTYMSGGSPLEVLSEANLEVRPGEVVAIVGASGTGKSTLLHLLGALDQPTAGEILVDGEAYSALSTVQLDRLRNQKLGFVFQFHHLLREFSALENVMMPLLIAGRSNDQARSRAEEILADVSRDRMTAARKTLGSFSAGGDPAPLIDTARRVLIHKGDDAHDYKFGSAVLEDYRHVSPAVRGRFLAASMMW